MAFISNGTTMLDAGAFSVSLGSMVHIKTLTASSSANLSFVHGTSGVVFNNTYPIYLFKFINIHPATNNVQLMHNASIDAASNYNVVATTTTFEGESYESDQNNTLNYITSHDHAQDSGGKKLTYNMGNDNDQSLSGEMMIFNPSSSTFVKHFISKVSNYHHGDYEKNTHTAGYYNTTSDLDAIKFFMSSGNMDSGTIKLYGIKDS
tara:strand:- start:655 stop:1272 length:618 start_codon:yes stop_codon:yes gene_type:complete